MPGGGHDSQALMSLRAVALTRNAHYGGDRMEDTGLRGFADDADSCCGGRAAAGPLAARSLRVRRRASVEWLQENCVARSSSLRAINTGPSGSSDDQGIDDNDHVGANQGAGRRRGTPVDLPSCGAASGSPGGPQQGVTMAFLRCLLSAVAPGSSLRDVFRSVVLPATRATRCAYVGLLSAAASNGSDTSGYPGSSGATAAACASNGWCGEIGSTTGHRARPTHVLVSSWEERLEDVVAALEDYCNCKLGGGGAGGGGSNSPQQQQELRHSSSDPAVASTAFAVWFDLFAVSFHAGPGGGAAGGLLSMASSATRLCPVGSRQQPSAPSSVEAVAAERARSLPAAIASAPGGVLLLAGREGDSLRCQACTLGVWHALRKKVPLVVLPPPGAELDVGLMQAAFEALAVSTRAVAAAENFTAGSAGDGGGASGSSIEGRALRAMREGADAGLSGTAATAADPQPSRTVREGLVASAVAAVNAMLARPVGPTGSSDGSAAARGQRPPLSLPHSLMLPSPPSQFVQYPPPPPGGAFPVARSRGPLSGSSSRSLFPRGTVPGRTCIQPDPSTSACSAPSGDPAPATTSRTHRFISGPSVTDLLAATAADRPPSQRFNVSSSVTAPGEGPTMVATAPHERMGGTGRWGGTGEGSAATHSGSAAAAGVGGDTAEGRGSGAGRPSGLRPPRSLAPLLPDEGGEDMLLDGGAAVVLASPRRPQLQLRGGALAVAPWESSPLPSPGHHPSGTSPLAPWSDPVPVQGGPSVAAASAEAGSLSAPLTLLRQPSQHMPHWGAGVGPAGPQSQGSSGTNVPVLLPALPPTRPPALPPGLTRSPPIKSPSTDHQCQQHQHQSGDDGDQSPILAAADEGPSSGVRPRPPRSLPPRFSDSPCRARSRSRGASYAVYSNYGAEPDVSPAAAAATAAAAAAEADAAAAVAAAALVASSRGLGRYRRRQNRSHHDLIIYGGGGDGVDGLTFLSSPSSSTTSGDDSLELLESYTDLEPAAAAAPAELGMGVGATVSGVPACAATPHYSSPLRPRQQQQRPRDITPTHLVRTAALDSISQSAAFFRSGGGGEAGGDSAAPSYKPLTPDLARLLGAARLLVALCPTPQHLQQHQQHQAQALALRLARHCLATARSSRGANHPDTARCAAALGLLLHHCNYGGNGSGHSPRSPPHPSQSRVTSTSGGLHAAATAGRPPVPAAHPGSRVGSRAASPARGGGGPSSAATSRFSIVAISSARASDCGSASTNTHTTTTAAAATTGFAAPAGASPPASPLVGGCISGVVSGSCEGASGIADAEGLLRGATIVLERYLGPDHLEVLAARRGLATVLAAGGRHDEAALLLQRALASGAARWRPACEAALAAAMELAAALAATERPREARKLLKDTLSTLQEDEDEAAAAAAAAAMAAARTARSVSAASYSVHVAGSAVPIHAVRSPRAGLSAMKRTELQARACQSLAALKASAGSSESARGLYAQAVEGYTVVYGRRHAVTTACMLGLAGQLAEARMYDEALAQYRAVLELYLELYGPHHPATSRVSRRMDDVEEEAAAGGGGEDEE